MKITIEQLVENKDLDYDDLNDWGLGKNNSWSISADYDNEEEALDWFHDHYGIAVLEDFEITCQ